MPSGWFYVRGEPTIDFRSHASGDEEWPPKYSKLILETAGASKVEAAFTDSRRFGRIRLVDCPGDDIRQHTPLKENGPDPVIDKDILTAEWLEKKMNSKKVPIKTMMLDQANISGIGNWVGLVCQFPRKCCITNRLFTETKSFTMQNSTQNNTAIPSAQTKSSSFINRYVM